MKAIMISIKPKWVAKILNGEKTIEIRKTCPEIFKHLKTYEGCSIDVYIYCTKDSKGQLHYSEQYGAFYDIYKGPEHYSENGNLNGKVVAKFTLNKITPTYHFYEEEICSLSCLSDDELFNYLGHDDGYAWQIDNLVIFDEPKYLCDFWNTKKGVFCRPFIKAPQSWCYVEGESYEM